MYPKNETARHFDRYSQRWPGSNESITSNLLGQMHSCFVLLFRSEPPSAPQHVRVIQTGPTWTYLSWEKPSFLGFPLSSAKQYVVTALQRGGQSTRQIAPTASLSVNATGLLPNSVYELSVVAQSVVEDAMASSSPSAAVLTMTTTTGK